jgi:hypothetical protein
MNNLYQHFLSIRYRLAVSWSVATLRLRTWWHGMSSYKKSLYLVFTPLLTALFLINLGTVWLAFATHNTSLMVVGSVFLIWDIFLWFKTAKMYADFHEMEMESYRLLAKFNDRVLEHYRQAVDTLNEIASRYPEIFN